MWKTVSRYKWISFSNKHSRNARQILRIAQKHNQNFHTIKEPISSSNYFQDSWTRSQKPFQANAKFCTNITDADSDEQDNLDDQDHNVVDSLIFSLKNILYDEQTDEGIMKLNNCQNVDEIFELADNELEHFTNQQCVQTVITLWEQLKFTRNISSVNNRFSVNSFLLDKPIFQKFLEKLESITDELQPDELTVCLLYLSKLGVGMEHKTMRVVLQNCLNIMKNPDSDFPLTALSRFTVAINSSKRLYTFFVCQDALPRILNYLENINDAEQLRLITICFNNLHQLITPNSLQNYKIKVQQLYDNGTLNENTEKSLLKVLQFLNYPHWSQDNTILIRNLMLLLKDKILNFQVKELESYFKVFESQLEPAFIAPLIIQRAQQLYEQTPTAILLACTVMYTLPDKRKKMTKIAEDILYLNNSKIRNTNSSIPILFKVLRLLKISEPHICNRYWSMVLHEIQTNTTEQETFILARHFHRYMYFNNNLGGTYRHNQFERIITNFLLVDLQNGVASLIPTIFAKLTSFILAYGQTSYGKLMFPPMIIEKIEKMHQQFTVLDCLYISRGIQIALELRYKYQMQPEIAAQLHRIDLAMNLCAERHLNNPNLTLGQLNCILRAYNNRKNSKKTSLFNKILSKYDLLATSQMSSRLIKDITFNLNASNCILPNVCAQMFQYIVENKDYVLGETVEKALFCCYRLGYIPENDDAVKYSADIIQRDFNYMSGLSIVQACLALSFYKAIPDTLVTRVFNIDFIKRLEDEIKHCYSKETYPQKILNQVMQLNRSICLDFPECSVPWFQQNYIEAQLSKTPVIKNQFHMDIKEILLSFVNDSNLLKIDEITSYGYKIDFVYHLDKNKKIVAPPKNDNRNLPCGIDRVAILLMKLDSFCQNDSNHLRGHEYLRHRHLELLGYKVLQIKFTDWYSIYMSMPGAKNNYLKNLLQIA